MLWKGFSKSATTKVRSSSNHPNGSRDHLQEDGNGPLIGWLAIAKTDEVVTVTGKLEPLGSVQVIQMPEVALLQKFWCKTGKK